MGGASDGSGFSIKGRRELLVRVPVGFINASGVGRGAIVEIGLRDKLSSSAESSKEAFSGIGEFVAVVQGVVPLLSASEVPKNENLLLKIGTLKFGVTLETLFPLDEALCAVLRVIFSMSPASRAWQRKVGECCSTDVDSCIRGISIWVPSPRGASVDSTNG
jgi:hypothetical protein